MSYSCCRNKVECDGCGDCVFPDGLCYDEDEDDYYEDEEEDEYDDDL